MKTKIVIAAAIASFVSPIAFGQMSGSYSQPQSQPPQSSSGGQQKTTTATTKTSNTVGSLRSARVCDPEYFRGRQVLIAACSATIRSPVCRWNAEDLFHHHGDRLHEFAAAHRARLRKSAGRCDRALSSAQRRKSFLSDRGRSARPESAAISGESGRSTGGIRQRRHPKVCRSLEKARCEIRRMGGDDRSAPQESRSGNAATAFRCRTNL